MSELPHEDIGRPIRVVVFDGAFADSAAERFLVALGQHPEIELLGGFRQVRTESLVARVGDLWHRRGILALPLLVVHLVEKGVPFLRAPWSAVPFRRALHQIERQITRVPDVHAPGVLEAVRALAPDLGLIYGAPILRPELFDIPRWGTLGIHHGTLPAYRGKKTTFWEVYEGEPAAGVTIQRVNARIDCGEVVRAGSVRTAGKSYRRVEREVSELGIELYLAAVLEVKRGQARLSRPAGSRGKLRHDPTVRQLLELHARQLRARLRSGSSE